MITEITVKVDFTNHTLTKKDSGVVEGDYNSTKLIFDFVEDIQGHKVMFNLGNSEGKILMIEELETNEVMLSGHDAEGNICSLFTEPGVYPFELVLYGENSKLTSAPGYLNVSKRWAKGEEVIFEPNLAFFDQLMQEVGELESRIALLESQSGVTPGTATSVTLTDISTGKKYKLYIDNSKLTMEEVTT